MAHRNKLNKKKRKALIITLSYWLTALVICPILIGLGLKNIALIAFTFLLSGGVVFYLHYYYCILCLKCKKSLGFVIFSSSKNFFKISDELTFCPYCGVSFDKEV